MSSHATRRHSQIGLDRLVRLKWLERTAYLVLAGNEAPAVKAALQEELRGEFRSPNTKVRGSLNKTITILMRIWVRPPRDLRPFQRDGLGLLSNLPRHDHVAIHWGMAMAVYPFWGAVAAHVGRLLKLQGTVAASQVQRRLRERYGERETVSRRVRYVLRSFISWKVLKETSKTGIYQAGPPLPVNQPEQVAWLAEAVLHARPHGPASRGAGAGGPVGLRTLLESTSLFPFRLAPVSATQLGAVSGRLDVLPHGLDQELIVLRS